MVWSSAIKTLILSDMDVTTHCEDHADTGTGARTGLDLYCAPELLDAFTHAQQAKSVLVPERGEVGGVKSDTVVLNLRLDGVFVPRQAESHVARLGMAQNICQRFLGDPEQDGLDLRRQSV